MYATLFSFRAAGFQLGGQQKGIAREENNWYSDVIDLHIKYLQAESSMVLIPLPIFTSNDDLTEILWL